MHPRLSSILFCYFSAVALVAAISINIPGLIPGVNGNRFFNSISHIFNGVTAGDCSDHAELISIPKPKDESSLPLDSDTNEANAVAKNQANNEEGDGNGQSSASNTGEIDFASSWSRALSNIMDRTSPKPKVANPDCMDKHPLLTPLQVLLMPSRAHLESHYRAEKQQQNQNAVSEDDSTDAAAVIEGSESVAVGALPNTDTQNLVYIPHVKRQEDGSGFNSTTTSSTAPTSSLSSSTVTVSTSASGTGSVTSTLESSESVSSSTITESASSSLDTGVSTSTPSSTAESSESSTTAAPTEISASTSQGSSAVPSTESQASTSTSQAGGSTTASTQPESSTESSTNQETTTTSESGTQSLTTAQSTTTPKDSFSESSESSTTTSISSETPEVTSSASTLLSTTTSSGVVHTITQVTFVLITHTPTRSPASSTHSSSSSATSATSATSQSGSLQTKENAGASLINRSVGSSSNLVMLVTSIATLSLMFVGVGFGSVLLA